MGCQGRRAQIVVVFVFNLGRESRLSLFLRNCCCCYFFLCVGRVLYILMMDPSFFKSSSSRPELHMQKWVLSLSLFFFLLLGSQQPIVREEWVGEAITTRHVPLLSRSQRFALMSTHFSLLYSGIIFFPFFFILEMPLVLSFSLSAPSSQLYF